VHLGDRLAELFAGGASQDVGQCAVHCSKLRGRRSSGEGAGQGHRFHLARSGETSGCVGQRVSGRRPAWHISDE
jgi:hypothetical protein